MFELKKLQNSLFVVFLTILMSCSHSLEGERTLSSNIKGYKNCNELIVKLLRKPQWKDVSFNRAELKSLLKDYPQVEISYERLVDQIEVSKKIKKVSEIPFKMSDEFRSPKAVGKMVNRSGKIPLKMQRMIKKVYNTLNDKKYLTDYFQQLFIESSLWMRRQNRPKDIKLLKKGLVSNEAIEAVIVSRLKAEKDDNFVTLTSNGITKGKSFVDKDSFDLSKPNQAFRASVRAGPFYDQTFDKWERYGHGHFTHIIQREIVSEALSSYKNEQEFWDFLSTSYGVAFWVDIFDSNGRNVTSPEYLSEFIMHNLSGRD